MWVNHPVYQNYAVSIDGQVKHINKDNCRKVRLDRYGYERLNLVWQGNRNTVSVHKLVAQCFVPNPDGLPTVNHIDGNKRNNHADNLEWLSFGDNSIDSFNRPHARCSVVIINSIRYRSLREAGRMLDICRFKISKYCGDKDYPHFELKD